MHVIAIVFDDVREVLAHRPELLWAVVRILSRRLRATDEALADAMFLDVPGRPAKRLLELADGDDEFRNHVAGPGPYRVTEFKAGDKLGMTAFDDHWAGKPAIQTGTLREMPEMAARNLAPEAPQRAAPARSCSAARLFVGRVDFIEAR